MLTILDFPHSTSKRRPKRWVAGLAWEGFKSADSNRHVRRHALEQAADLHTAVNGDAPTHYVVSSKKSVYQLVGCGSVHEKASDLYPAALLFIDAFAPARDFIVACQLPENVTWLLEVVDGRVMPGSDVVCPTHDADKRIVETENDVPGITVHRFAIGNLPSELQDSYSRVPKLRRIVGAKQRRVLLGASLGLAALALGIGAFAWWNQAETVPELTEAERQAIMNAHRQPVELPPVAYPWADSPSFKTSLERCVTLFAGTNDLQGGWQLSDWQCDSQRVASTWSRLSYGRFSEPPEGAAFDPRQPNRAEQTTALDPLGAQGLMPLVDANEASAFVMDIARLHDAAVNIRWGEEATRLVPTQNGDGEVSQALGYAENQVTITAQTLPGVEFFSALAQIPSLTLSQLRFTGSGWELVMDLYTTPLES